MAVPMVSSAKNVIFGGFKRRVASFRVAGVALRDIETCFITCRELFCVAGTILLRRLQKMRCSFRGRGSTLETIIVILRGGHSTFDVSCGSFCANCIVRAGWSDKVQIILWDVLKINGSLTRNIDFEAANFHVPRKTRRKTSILKLQSVKIGGSLARNARLMLQHVSSRVSGFPLASPYLWGETAKSIPFEGVKSGCNVVLPGRRGTSWHWDVFRNVSRIVLCGRHNTLAPFSEDEFQFFWQAQHYTPHSTLHTLHSTLHTLHFTLHTPHFTLYTLHATLHTLHSTLLTLHSTLYTVHFTRHTLQFTLHTPYFKLHTPHFALHTLNSTLHTLHSTLHSLHLNSTLYTLYFTTLHSTLCTLHFPLHTLHSTLYTPHSLLYTPHFTLYTPHSTLYTPHSTLHTLHSTLYTPHSTLYTPRFTLHTLHSTLHTLHSTLYTPHSTLYTPHSTLCTPPSSAFHSLQCTGTVTGEKCRLFK